jgi:hypothetical protein
MNLIQFICQPFTFFIDLIYLPEESISLFQHKHWYENLGPFLNKGNIIYTDIFKTQEDKSIKYEKHSINFRFSFS